MFTFLLQISTFMLIMFKAERFDFLKSRENFFLELIKFLQLCFSKDDEIRYFLKLPVYLAFKFFE